MKKKIYERCMVEYNFSGKTTLTEYPYLDLDGSIDGVIEELMAAKAKLGTKYSRINLEREYNCQCAWEPCTDNCSSYAYYVCYGYREETDSEYEARLAQ